MPTLAELAQMSSGDNSGAYVGYPQLQRQAAKMRLAQIGRTPENLPDPKTYGFVSGFLGTSPDQLGMSVLSPNTAPAKDAAYYGYQLSNLGQIAPAALPIVKNVGRTAVQSIDEAIARFAPGSTTVYHGSPHTFDRFDISKIGTGEGQQAYGRGLYVAQNPNVAQEYQRNLSKDVFNVDGQIFDPTKLQHLNVKTLVYKNKLEDAIEKAKQISISDSPSANLAKQDLSVLQDIQNKGGLQKHEGNFYKVDVPTRYVNRMLDWDEPLKNQPTHIRKLAKSLGLDLNDAGGDLIGYLGKGEEGKKVLQDAGISGIKYLDQTSRNAHGWHITPADETVKGKWMVKSGDYRSNGLFFDTEAEAKKALKEKLGSATKNMVVFDGNHLKIIERNEKPIK
jgi:hypothetical protein